MAHETRIIEGHEVNLTVSKTGIVRGATILFGPVDKPGWRLKDGPAARIARRAAKRQVMEALDLPAKAVSVMARYSSLVENESGTIVKRDNDGNIIGTYGD